MYTILNRARLFRRKKGDTVPPRAAVPLGARRNYRCLIDEAPPGRPMGRLRLLPEDVLGVKSDGHRWPSVAGDDRSEVR
jgi:hypothetical protein